MSQPPSSPSMEALAEQLQVCEARYRTLFDNAQLGIVLTDAKGYYLDANASACQLFGYSRDEFVGLHASDIVVQSEVSHIDSALGEIQDRSDHHREWQFRRKDGTVFVAEVIATLMPDGTLMGMIRDLSDRNAAQTYRDRMAAIVESTSDAIISTDLNGIVTSWNAGAEVIYGYTAADIIGTPVTRLYPADKLSEATLILEKIRRGERIELLEAQRHRKDGQLIYVSIAASPLKDSRGSILGTSAIVRDVTALKERDREIARMSRLYAALSQINQAIVWTADRDELLQKVCQALVDDGGFCMAWIGWHRADTDGLRPVAVYGDDGSLLPSLMLAEDYQYPASDLSVSLAVIALRSHQPYICNDALNDPATSAWRGAIAHGKFRASAHFPIWLDETVVGVLNVYAEQPNVFYDKEVALLQEAAGDLSFALNAFARDEARRQAEQSLRDEMRFTDTMIESMPGILYFYDTEGHFLRWNQNFERVSGYSADEITQMHPLHFFADDDRARLEQRIGQVFTEGESSIEAAFVSKDGTATPYFFTGQRVQFENSWCLVGVGIDLSERRRAEALLAESERKYRELVEHANSIILRWNAEGRITFLNGYGQQFFGYSEAEILGCHVMETIVPPIESSGRDLQQLMNAVCADPTAFEQNINENVRRDGQHVWVAWTNRIELDADGNVVEILSIGTDMTARLQAEAEREKRHQAEAADRIKSAFLATMSHELRTPLNSIIGFTGIILQELAGPLNAEQSKQLAMVRTSARHLLALVNDVLDISKIEAGQLEVAREPFDLHQSIAKVVAIVQPQAAAKSLDLRVEVAPNLGEAVADQRRFEQVLLNLLSNAIKFTDYGEVTLVAELVDDYWVPGAESAAAVRLRVADTGMGIQTEDLPALFQPFQQIDSGLARNHDGTGLGLAICHRLVDLMGGDIQAKSTWGEGSTFTVTLPLQVPETL
ncbi:PAS domain S-box protein [Leptolyngbya sp. CCNP1308]|uniref:PAS domain S-box protein n=1 Tax=Leptolyngbya sp. CCNP1308 TaxID=3110255 RepID=UPI002B21AD33|nr:PAS domain S-box protein [Leptolyngbya sp. CCNP1308]MEA5447470.1 PAS domain S-box protein [Leptolyngbya sp. CCNP1308]